MGRTKLTLLIIVLLFGVGASAYWLGKQSNSNLVESQTADTTGVTENDTNTDVSSQQTQTATSSTSETASAPAQPETSNNATLPADHPSLDDLAMTENLANQSAQPNTPDTSTPANHPPLDNLAASANPSDQSAQRAHNKFTHFRVGNRNVKSMLADGNLVWVGTSGGVIRYDLQNDTHRLFDNRSGLLANGIFHISRLKNKLAVGTYGGGLSLFDEQTETWENYNIPDGLADAFVYDTLESKNGDIWIATWSGANRIRGGALKDSAKWEVFTVENTDSGLPNDWVYALREDTEGNIWFATEGGLARYKDEQWQNWSHEDGLGAPYELVRDQLQFDSDPSRVSDHHARQKVEQGLQNVDVAYNPNYIVALAIDNKGVVWCGTWGGGLARFDGTNWKNFTVADGLPANHVFMLATDDTNRLWIGTSNGLARQDEDGFTVFNTSDGLFAENVFSMAMANDSSMWVGGYGGVARLFDLL